MSEKRMRVHRHNGYRGSLKLTRANLFNIIASDATTPEAKQKAEELIPEIDQLWQLMETRVDPPF